MKRGGWKREKIWRGFIIIIIIITRTPTNPGVRDLGEGSHVSASQGGGVRVAVGEDEEGVSHTSQGDCELISTLERDEGRK